MKKPTDSREPPNGRRHAMLCALSCAAAPLAAMGAQEDRPVPAGPVVWRGLTQKQLDQAFDQLAYAPNSQQVLHRYRSRSDDVAGRLVAPQRLQYGASASEFVNIYRTSRPNAPVHVFVHGGAWVITDARDYVFLAEMFVNSGVHFVIPDFASVKDLAGDLVALARQVRESIAWIARHASTFGGDAKRLHFSGHSSGAHLLAVALTHDWKTEQGIYPDGFRSALLLSGIYDLEPVSLSERSSYVRLTDKQVVAALSPLQNASHFACAATVGHGSLDTPEYQRQSRALVDALIGSGRKAQLIKAEFYNHFEQLETLGNPYGTFGRAALDLIRTE
ncbi:MULTISPECIES: alpha/beta hydrolase [Variovorax]|uniref:alpha/beta hydrolase n=1 Tax=Variovorax TaxID=34072 RepID=UPI0012FD881D|nr:alpha/beta hydrolase [Variovorax paradoxus]